MAEVEQVTGVDFVIVELLEIAGGDAQAGDSGSVFFFLMLVGKIGKAEERKGREGEGGATFGPR